MINYLFLLLIFIVKINTLYSYILPQTFKIWHPIAFDKTIDKTKPYVFNIGKLELVTWFDKQNITKPMTTINICKHMGSKLNKGKVINGCLKCPYHEMEYTKNDICGETIIHEDKLWWSYKPNNKYPPSIPLYNNNKYETVHFEKNINANILDCMLNFMNINQQIKIYLSLLNKNLNENNNNVSMINYIYKDKHKINDKLGVKYNNTHFNMYEHPYTSWLCFTTQSKEKIFIHINMLPISENKTKIFISLRFNCFKNLFHKNIIKIILLKIINDNYNKLSNQADTTFIKNYIIKNNNNNKFKNEEHLEYIKKRYENYMFPDNFCVDNFIKNIKFY